MIASDADGRRGADDVDVLSRELVGTGALHVHEISQEADAHEILINVK